LRTPVNAILGFSEVMKGELFGSHAIASYKEYSNDIHASGQHLLMLINEILDLSRIEAGRFDLKEEAVALTHIVEDCGHSCWQKSGRSPWKRPSNRISHGFGPTNVLFVK
jgi:two-component system, cell cycle sensor histidine kinase PleC